VYLLKVLKKAMSPDGEEEREKLGIKNFSPESMQNIKEYCELFKKKLKCGSTKEILGLKKAPIDVAVESEEDSASDDFTVKSTEQFAALCEGLDVLKLKCNDKIHHRGLINS